MNDADPTPVQVDVGISPDAWARIYADAVANYRDGQAPQEAFWSAVQEHITVHPNPMVDGEVKGLEDVDELAGAAGREVTVGDADSQLPDPFDAVPTIDDPSDSERELARVTFPPEAVPDEGPIPDIEHTHREDVTITVPEWALEATRWRLRHADVEELTRSRVEEFLLEYAQPRETFRTPAGEDAVDVLLDDLQDGENDA